MTSLIFLSRVFQSESPASISQTTTPVTLGDLNLSVHLKQVQVVKEHPALVSFFSSFAKNISCESTRFHS
jgi:hypothetical protein